MNPKYQQAILMGDKTRVQIISSSENWMQFLNTAAQNYKYSFREQLLIHAQKPEATACAEYSTWNKLGRWVKRGSKGILLPAGTNNNPKVRYVFDISMTDGSPAAKERIWTLPEDHTGIQDMLRKTYLATANILVATKKDFETQNRKRFCSRIATGDYDAIIIGHSQFEKIPMSIERQRKILEQQLDEITEGISELGAKQENRFSVKQLEKTKKAITLKLQKLNDQTRKDDVVTFEQLGVDRLFVDEAHNYKNLYLYTKMRNVGGIAQTEAQKSSDLYMKCRYMDELTDSKGIVFATGTPISNSMVELYTMQRYLQNDLLHANGLQHFDAWASTFGETVTALELAPEGYNLIGR